MNGKKDPIQETIALIQNDENNRAYFFSKAKDPKWFEPLNKGGFFAASTIPAPVKTEKGFALSLWPPQGYLDRVSVLIKEGALAEPRFINDFANVLRGITSTNGNFFLARGLFLMQMRLPLSCVRPSDIERSFALLLESDTRDTLAETAVHEGCDLMLSSVTDTAHDRELFKVFFRQFLAISKKEKYRDRDPKLAFFSDWGHKQFLQKHFNVESLAAVKSYIVCDAIDVSAEALTSILSATDLDTSTQWWRPAVEEHYQNSYHDSAQAIILGLLGLMGGSLVRRGVALPQLESWRASQFRTFNRLYIYLASQTKDARIRDEAAQKIFEIEFAYECMHEVFHFFRQQFDSLAAEDQNKVLAYIEGITSEDTDSEELKKKQTAWRQLRWLEAISATSNERAKKLRSEALSVTNGSVPEHPDFGSYMGQTWVGPTSPVDMGWLSTAKISEILECLLTFKDTSEFRSPSIDGLARVLESWVIADPMKASALIGDFEKLNPQYVLALLDGYAKCWAEKKYVPVVDLFAAIRKLIAPSRFAEQVADTKTRTCWVVTSICRFIEAGTRTDESAFEPALNDDGYAILKRCLEITPADERYEKSSDAYSRAINEPRGQVFEALVILTLRRARLAKDDAVAFARAWNDLRSLIDPILKKQDEVETSLHAHIGAYFRQFQFLAKDWLDQNIDVIAPSRTEKPSLWRAFMDGFSYVTSYSREMYLQLRDKGHLLDYLRLDVDAGEQSSRLDRLQTRVIELALVAYVLGDESLDDGIVASVLAERNSEEWHQVIWSIHSILGGEPEVVHLARAKELIARLIKIRDEDPSGTDFTAHFKGLGRSLDLIKDPTDDLAKSIVRIVASNKESHWDLGDVIDYLHQFKDSHPRVIAELFKLMLDASKAAPAWPPEKVQEIARALVQHGEKNSMIEVCRIYSERSPTCEPIREICASLGRS